MDGVESEDPEDGDVLQATLSRVEEDSIGAAVKEKFPAVFNEKCLRSENRRSDVSDAKMKLLLKTQLAVGTKKQRKDKNENEPLDACGLQIHGALDAFIATMGRSGVLLWTKLSSSRCGRQAPFKLISYSSILQISRTRRRNWR